MNLEGEEKFYQALIENGALITWQLHGRIVDRRFIGAEGVYLEFNLNPVERAVLEELVKDGVGLGASAIGSWIEKILKDKEINVSVVVTKK